MMVDPVVRAARLRAISEVRRARALRALGRAMRDAVDADPLAREAIRESVVAHVFDAATRGWPEASAVRAADAVRRYLMIRRES